MTLACLSAASSLSASPHVWRADGHAWNDAVLPTGHPVLNAHLPGGGWPLDGLVEVLQARPERHAWQLVLPALAQVAQAQPGPVVLVGTPFEPFGPALAAQGLPGERLLCVRSDKPAARLWAAEQALRCAGVAAVLAWLPQARADQLRRLHLAAQQGQRQRPLFVFRTLAAQHESSPARLRLLLQGTDALQVRILKRRGPPVDAPVLLPAHPPRLAALLAARRKPVAPTQPLTGTTPPVPTHAHALDRPVTA
ncbi:MAG: translesion DNA synthesis-associated protein ImuA [Proteobacteria bacterium]|nr:translesion DNA synthesis-associated protein ImuA [Ramlibacter sp.]MCA0213946.1 translesion DNA synthesis-associated protein ImuA [Pseudomonadota bacterium]